MKKIFMLIFFKTALSLELRSNIKSISPIILTRNSSYELNILEASLDYDSKFFNSNFILKLNKTKDTLYKDDTSICFSPELAIKFSFFEVGIRPDQEYFFDITESRNYLIKKVFGKDTQYNFMIYLQASLEYNNTLFYIFSGLKKEQWDRMEVIPYEVNISIMPESNIFGLITLGKREIFTVIAKDPIQDSVDLSNFFQIRDILSSTDYFSFKLFQRKQINIISFFAEEKFFYRKQYTKKDNTLILNPFEATVDIRFGIDINATLGVKNLSNKTRLFFDITHSFNNEIGNLWMGIETGFIFNLY